MKRWIIALILLASTTVALAEPGKQTLIRALEPPDWTVVESAKQLSPAVIAALKHPRKEDLTLTITVSPLTKLPKLNPKVRKSSIENDYKKLGLVLLEDGVTIVKNQPEFFSYRGSFLRNSEHWHLYGIALRDRQDLLHATFIGKKSELETLKNLGEVTEKRLMELYSEKSADEKLLTKQYTALLTLFSSFLTALLIVVIIFNRKNP